MTDVLLLPLGDPLRFAEEVATLDCLNGGRTTVGVAPGYVSEEFGAFDVPREERFGRCEESVDLLRALWTGGEVAHAGRYYRHPLVRLSPPPIQEPPPIWFGVSGERLLRSAARRGLPVVVSPRHSAVEVERQQQIYDAASREFGTGCEERPIIREVVVAATSQHAERLAEPAIRAAFDLYVRKSAAGERALRTDSGELVTEADGLAIDAFRSRCLVGDPTEWPSRSVSSPRGSGSPSLSAASNCRGSLRRRYGRRSSSSQPRSGRRSSKRPRFRSS